MTVLKKVKKAAALKKYLLRKCDCCVEVVTLKKCEKVVCPKIELSCKSRNTSRREIATWKKKNKQIRLVIKFNWNYFPERFPHPEKYSYEIPHE